MDSSLDETRNTSDLKACMNFKWTDELTMQFILYRHERRHLFTKKRNTSRYGWQHILRDMGLAAYVTPYQAQKKWNNLWSKYKMAKRAQVDGTIEEDPNSSWPFFTLLDAIASGKSVAITSPGMGTFPQVASGPATPNSASATTTTTNSSIIHAASVEEPIAKKAKTDESIPRMRQWEEPEDQKQQIIELLQANLHQLDEVKVAIETQGQTIVSMLSQLIHIISNNSKANTNATVDSVPNRIDEAISATIREIGISQENM